MARAEADSTASLFDAHCHLADARLAHCVDAVVADARAAGVRHAVVNGTQESDWAAVATLCGRFPHGALVPSFGLHPWHVHAASADWAEALEAALAANKRAALGECGLHAGSGADAPMAQQVAALRQQLRIATRVRRPAALHCVRAFGPLHDTLAEAAPPSGFLDSGLLLHSYSGSAEEVPRLAALGAHFSFSATLASVASRRAAAVLRAVPDDRICFETDAPDGLPRRGGAHELQLQLAPPAPQALAFGSPACRCGEADCEEDASAPREQRLNQPVRANPRWCVIACVLHSR
jgi:TatD DNase family protein